MAYLMDWVIQLVTLIFIIMIIEMLIPQTSLKKYVHTVLSFVFLLLFLQPIFQLFQVDIEDAISQSFRLFEEQTSQSELENEIELKKKDIQATQSAYVIEELAIQLENQVEGELRKTYGVEISEIKFDYETELDQSLSNLQKIKIYIATVELGTGLIEEVIIGRDVAKDENENQNHETTLSEVQMYLYQVWDLETDMLTVFWEEGS
ncbi:stage III sporulation protein AF [Natronobacillus azotifigens]|uniref:Stage III sporulation protein AF n=1 Tax=Natronobacillus azotifigens TaxID=472978 RepID=A0A9J6REV2_9BACI|nr:stage III sporulation protein AF [Natronobacillus azotifigens]MCZ0704087.1 stage III sporulation protein AF [Natronobacillus azotifigens]